MDNALRIAGILAACAAAVLALAGSNLNASGLPQDVHPNGAIAMALTSLAFLKASGRA